jgi:hypothetical protein
MLVYPLRGAPSFETSQSFLDASYKRLRASSNILASVNP